MALSIATRGTPYHNTSNIGAQTMVDGGTPTADRLLVFCAVNNGNANAATAMAGYGLTWTKVGAFGWAAAWGIDIWAAFSKGANTTAPVSTFAASTGRHMVMLEVSGVNTGTSDVLNCFRQQSAGVYIASSNTTATSISFAVATPLNAANRHVGVIGHTANEASTAQANYTAIENATGFITPSSTIVVETSNDGARTTSGASWVTSSICGGVAFEIIASVPSRLYPPRLRESNHLLMR